jgi:hypothetical protein
MDIVKGTSLNKGHDSEVDMEKLPIEALNFEISPWMDKASKNDQSVSVLES